MKNGLWIISSTQTSNHSIRFGQAIASSSIDSIPKSSHFINVLSVKVYWFVNKSCLNHTYAVRSILPWRSYPCTVRKNPHSC